MCLGMTLAVNHLRVRSAWISASARLRSAAVIRAVLWDFGGVILSSPFEAFNRYEEQAGLPKDFIRTVNATEPHSNAWARLERSEVVADRLRRAVRGGVAPPRPRGQGRHVLDLLHGEIRPEMVEALRRVRAAGLATACLTNNVVSGDDAEHPDPTGRREQVAVVMAMFDAIVESSKVGVRKPEPRFYEIACELLGVAARRVRVPRRSRHQPQARRGDGHDDHQGRERGASVDRPGTGARDSSPLSRWYRR